MRLAVERHNERLYLVLHETLTSEEGVLLAEFRSEATAASWKAAHAHALMMARAVEASGI